MADIQQDTSATNHQIIGKVIRANSGTDLTCYECDRFFKPHDMFVVDMIYPEKDIIIYHHNKSDCR